MKRARRRKSAGDYERWVGLPHWMLRSPAWKSLSPNAKALLIDVWQRHNGSNNGEISYAVREAAEIGLGRTTAARAFAELVERGFLVMTRDSAFTVKTRAARLWRITAVPCGGNRATKDFMCYSATPDGAGERIAKSRIQSVQGDTQSPIADCDRADATILPLTVRAAGLSATKTTSAQSHQEDTSILPGGSRSNAGAPSPEKV